TVDAFAVGASGGGGDYTPTSGTLTFAPGETSKTITVPITGDSLWEGSEFLVLTLSDPSAGFQVDTERYWPSLVIDDNEPAPPEDDDGTSDAPVAGNDYYYANFQQGSAYTLPPDTTVLDNDFDTQDQPLTITTNSSPTHGSLAVQRYEVLTNSR